MVRDIYCSPAGPMAAPAPGAAGTDSSAGILTGRTSSDTAAWELHGGYSTATDRATATIAPGDGGVG